MHGEYASGEHAYHDNHRNLQNLRKLWGPCRGGVTADAMDRLKVGTKCTRGIQGGIVW